MARKHSHHEDLEHCLACGRDFVNPVEWEAVDDHSWWMLLRCGECETWREVTVSNAVAQRFDSELDRRLDVIARAWQKVDRQRMASEMETIIGALRHGLLDAADFAR